MLVRFTKMGLVALVGTFLWLVGADNLLDYGTNYAFVQHVMTMDTLPPHASLLTRAVVSPWAHHAVYLLIISAQLCAGLLCLAGVLRLFRARRSSADCFNPLKATAIAGLGLAFALWFFGFMVVGGEWFQMWQSPTWNGQQAAFRFIGCVGLVLLFLNQKDEDVL